MAIKVNERQSFARFCFERSSCLIKRRRQLMEGEGKECDRKFAQLCRSKRRWLTRSRRRGERIRLLGRLRVSCRVESSSFNATPCSPSEKPPTRVMTIFTDGLHRCVKVASHCVIFSWKTFSLVRRKRFFFPRENVAFSTRGQCGDVVGWFTTKRLTWSLAGGCGGERNRFKLPFEFIQRLFPPPKMTALPHASHLFCRRQSHLLFSLKDGGVERRLICLVWVNWASHCATLRQVRVKIILHEPFHAFPSRKNLVIVAGRVTWSDRDTWLVDQFPFQLLLSAATRDDERNSSQTCPNVIKLVFVVWEFNQFLEFCFGKHPSSCY